MQDFTEVNKKQLNELISLMAQEAFKLGLEPECDTRSPLAEWIRANAKYLPHQEFFINFLVACELGKLQRGTE